MLGGLSVQLPFAGIGSENATVYDFQGTLARAHILGTGMGNGTLMYTDVDFGFAQGVYVDAKGVTGRGTFLFI